MDNYKKNSQIFLACGSYAIQNATIIISLRKKYQYFFKIMKYIKY